MPSLESISRSHRRCLVPRANFRTATGCTSVMAIVCSPSTASGLLNRANLAGLALVKIAMILAFIAIAQVEPNRWARFGIILGFSALVLGGFAIYQSRFRRPTQARRLRHSETEPSPDAADGTEPLDPSQDPAASAGTWSIPAGADEPSDLDRLFLPSVSCLATPDEAVR